MAAADFTDLPADLPVPEDDGAARHLAGLRVPELGLPASGGGTVRLGALPGRAVVFAYPRTGTPGEEPLGGEAGWNAIPGARGCTPQACAVRDEHARFEELGVRVFGLSTQSPAEQHEAADRLRLPYPLLSDQRLALTEALGLPTFEVDGVTLLRRLTLLIADGGVDDVVYPVFPPTAAPAQALERLEPASG